MTTARERMVRVVAEALEFWVNQHGGALMESDADAEFQSASEAVVAALEAQMGLRETVPLTNLDGETFRQLSTDLIGDDDE